MGEISTLAKLAHQRLASGFWHEEQGKRKQKLSELASNGIDTAAAKNFMVTQTKEQIENTYNAADEILYQRVKTILISGNSQNPLAVLIDHEKMQGMDDTTRQRYIFGLSAKLQDFRNRFEKEQQFNCQSMSL